MSTIRMDEIEVKEPVQRLFAGKESQGRSNGVNWYKACVRYVDGRMVPGTRSLHTYPEGRALNKALKNITTDILNGAWANKLPQNTEE